MNKRKLAIVFAVIALVVSSYSLYDSYKDYKETEVYYCDTFCGGHLINNYTKCFNYCIENDDLNWWGLE